ncbi:MAG: polymer-forming cytoskeletal protein [Allosphingosinicella sp.]|uniref:bactofilin family protein n=1 Tax=Allosphingosinicella sp. TaxID=2823234 RepID=UPI00392791DA
MFGQSRKDGVRAGAREKGGLSFIGPEAVVSGDLRTDAQLHVDGRVEGDVRCAGLIQGEKGAIAGNVVADQARLAGLVEGRVEAKTLIVEGSARVLGDIAYETLSIAPGARVEGRLSRIAGAEEGAALAAIAPAKALANGADPKDPPLIAIAEAPRAAAG